MDAFDSPLRWHPMTRGEHKAKAEELLEVRAGHIEGRTNAILLSIAHALLALLSDRHQDGGVL